MNTITKSLTSSNSPSIIILAKQQRSLPSPTTNLNKHSFFLPPQPHRFNSITCNTTSTNNNNNNNADDADLNSNSVQSPTADPAVGVKFRRRSSSRRQSKLQRENSSSNNGAAMQSSSSSSSSRRGKVSSAPKKWEEMSLTEKAIELYVGEKGALFWLNKFAYASIFIMIGAWIAFRFVGPALNLYQLDAPPLSPSDVLKGSPTS